MIKKFIRVAGRVIPVGKISKSNKLMKKASSKAAEHAKEYTDSSRKLSAARTKPSKNNGNVKLFTKRRDKAVSGEVNNKKRAEKLKNIRNKSIKKTAAGSAVIGSGSYLSLKKKKAKS